MQIVISGASGLIGKAVTRGLRGDGHKVLTLVRRPPTSASERQWDPQAGVLDTAALEGADAVINLSGAGIGDRLWTRARIRELSRSRILPTQTLVHGMKQLESPPSVFISQSASGYYGDAGRAILNEESPAGTGVLAGLCLEWEAAANEAPPGIRVITPRTGVVLSPVGGALGKLLPLLRLGLGGPLGNGRQYWPWITLPDVVSAFSFLLQAPLAGPVNVAAPHSAQLHSLISHLAAGLNRPALLKIPAPLLRLVMGQLADELLLASQRLDPVVLTSAGFQWKHPSLTTAAPWITGRQEGGRIS
ncbi:TIGR01777 family oxidoreductase [Arthrobacter rhizosphaerae]|uniref:TIGR01777 family oxidoreductase n=1 Tax=Arthrobacter rhizosphaerae TaxID=2855490 RepID=UPI001FF3A28A|nr:TIGR01777 family oxidoreductase [Arthrobacter rhizosphaerae]